MNGREGGLDSERVLGREKGRCKGGRKGAREGGREGGREQREREGWGGDVKISIFQRHKCQDSCIIF